MRTVKLGTLAALGASFVISLGCYANSAVQNHMGEARNENIARMTENPLASQATAPVEGIDPRTTEQVIEKYYELQRKVRSEKDRNQSLINIEF